MTSYSRYSSLVSALCGKGRGGVINGRRKKLAIKKKMISNVGDFVMYCQKLPKLLEIFVLIIRQI